MPIAIFLLIKFDILKFRVIILKTILLEKIMGIKENLDKFYTKRNVALNLINKIDLSDFDCIIEPSAGAGNFSEQIEHENIIALDLKPENKNIIEQDWFEYNIPEEYNNVIVIGNPPFGIRNNLSKKFIKHALIFDNVKTIAFVLPNVYNKHTNQNVFPKEWKLINIIPLEKNSFTLNGEDYNVPCSFFIWTKENSNIDLRYNENDHKTEDFEFVLKKNINEADFFTMGASPRVIKNREEVDPKNRGYYIKSKIDLNVLKERFKTIEWSKFGNSSANGGVSWYTKSELIKVYEENKLKVNMI